MFVLIVIGVSGCSRSVSSVPSGCTKRVRFSYRAKSRNSFGGVVPSVGALLMAAADVFSY